MQIGGGIGGAIEIAVCPRSIIPDSIWTVLDFAELAEKGNWPIAGGLLDQSHGFISACRFVWSDIIAWRLKHQN
jgi:hypothetical protein